MGTVILVVGVSCTNYKNPVHDKQPNTVMVHDLYVLITLYMARCFFAPLTGGYFNTAVTLGVFLNKNSNDRKTPYSKVKTVSIENFEDFCNLLTPERIKLLNLIFKESKI